ncbi:signal peptidase I [Natrialba magadii ATCC 43099]|uniref:Signal peptidase I n=1 Tax=Natrialba magadii (strain ATCC 43099 / DSM 3394 / CCM 3739 / CIP 104546 / IAM 13178 / JCM 8861 / NBRC 102185 / NCIMB 2190 / MS3) TaxID=547559 RepID=D3SVA7_NATMM|nr:S26 family signal peptidase [Natrialba magadii]ADD05515.1 signal peptidase I [Natrialba magadii ATCC 43099]ELY29522.1 signal peptidase I (signal sequence peptidase) [Natrialba magadii ATCC 43099]
MSDRPRSDSPSDSAADSSTRSCPDSVPRSSADSGPPSSSASDAPPADTAAPSSAPAASPSDGFGRWLLRSDDTRAVACRDAASVVAVVGLVGLLLVAFSGVWPPLAAVESGSMEPNVDTGDLVFVTDSDRFVGSEAVGETGVVTRDAALSGDGTHLRFGEPGDVIVFAPDGDESETPVIHRAHFWVEEGENWVETKADDDALGDRTCAALHSCPAPHDGFVTKGDANSLYDQVEGQYADTTVVKSEWVTSKSVVRLPWLGQVRVALESLFAVTTSPPLAGSQLVASFG